MRLNGRLSTTIDKAAMIIQMEISEQLSTAVGANYDGANYTGAILDAVFLLSDVLRDRTGCQSDGVRLIGEALGGSNPKLKLTPLRSESDRNTQKGTEAILRGVVQAIRNPRSHEKVEDAKDVADRIIAFIDYLLLIVNEAKAPFEIGDLIHRIHDKHFVESEDYSDLLVSEIPKEKLNEALTAIYESRAEVSPHVMRLMVLSILKESSAEDRTAFVAMVSDDLKTTEDNATIRIATHVFASDDWTQIARVARLRIENRLLKSLNEGEYESTSRTCTGGALGTWLSNVIDGMELRDQAIYTLTKKLGSPNRNEQDYVFTYYSRYLVGFGERPNDSMLSLFRNGLTSGDKRYYDLLSAEIIFSDDEWAKDLQPLLDSFEEKPYIPEDVLPF